MGRHRRRAVDAIDKKALVMASAIGKCVLVGHFLGAACRSLFGLCHRLEKWAGLALGAEPYLAGTALGLDVLGLLGRVYG